MATAPELVPRTWCRMPAYSKNGYVLCQFHDAAKSKSCYATFGLSDQAAPDASPRRATGFAITEMTPDREKRIAAMAKKALSRTLPH